MWAHRLCIICAAWLASSLFLAAAAHAGTVPAHSSEAAAHLADDRQIWPQPRPDLLMPFDEARRLAELDYAGDYAPGHNQNGATPPPAVKRRRSLLQDYSPVANQRSPSSPSTKGRKLLQDYSPVANQRSPSSPSKGRKLLQDYSPMANQRTPSSPKNHKP